MRAIGTMVLLGLVAARTAAAEPPETARSPRSETVDHGKADKAVAEKARTEKAVGPGIGSLAAMAATAAAREGEKSVVVRRLDLTPARQLAPGNVGKRVDRRGGERGSDLSLGDDSSWKVQAAQVGGMAAIFTALVAVCGNGRCLLPGGDDDDVGPPPGAFVSREQQLRDPR